MQKDSKLVDFSVKSCIETLLKMSPKRLSAGSFLEKNKSLGLGLNVVTEVIFSGLKP